MDYYAIVITVIDISVLLIMSKMTAENQLFSLQKRKKIIQTFSLIAVISFLEAVTVIVNGQPACWRWVNILVNYLVFVLSPMIPLMFCHAFSRNPVWRWAFYGEAAYAAVIALLLPFGGVFSISRDNLYSRQPGFFLYIAACLLAALYLGVETVRTTRQYQNKTRSIPYLCFLFYLAGMGIQIINSEIRLSWFCTTLLVLIYYTYFSSLWQQIDGLTGLLTQQCFHLYGSSIREGDIIVILDADNFKDINDTYGHAAGDEALKTIGEIIQHIYGRYGFCYRIGGDEFAVILSKGADVHYLDARFIQQIQKENAVRADMGQYLLPGMSVGSSVVHLRKGEDNFARAKEEADRRMYRNKQKNKEKYSDVPIG